MPEFDILILYNIPGEVNTQIRSAVRNLSKRLKNQGIHREISVILSPCPHATGKEIDMVPS